MTQLQSNNNVRQMQLDITPTNDEFSGKPRPIETGQQPLRLDAESIDPGVAIPGISISSSPETAPESSSRRREPKYLTGIALVTSTLLVLFIVWQGQDKPAPERPINFSATALSPAPEIKRTFRDIPFFESGETLQLGLYRQLSGAEAQQAGLARIGLLPHIEKRVEDAEVKYAVMIGPLGPVAHENTLAKLAANNVTYFHARGPLVKDRNKARTDLEGTGG